MGRRRVPVPPGRPGHYWIGVCAACGRYSYANRDQARSAARALFPGKSLRAYRCGQMWHFGPKKTRPTRGMQLPGHSAPKEIRA